MRIILCENDHECIYFENELPDDYESVKCDLCQATTMQENEDGYYHCNECQFDVCTACVVTFVYKKKTLLFVKSPKRENNCFHLP